MKVKKSRLIFAISIILSAMLILQPLNLAQTVTPSGITISGGAVCTGGSQTFPVSITLPPAAVVDKVDVFFLFDDTGSFAGFVPTVTSIFSGLVTSLETALPGVNFGFGVGRFEDYGGPGTGFSGESAVGRPFTLNQPIVTAATAGGAAARDALISTALSRTAPGFGGDGPESAIGEGLFQVGTGAGFDGDGNGSSLDSGPAGAVTTQTSPGTSGDVPPFSSNVLPASGTLGGVGFRSGALHLVILATDISSVATFPAGSPIPATITGAGGSSEPVTVFASVSTTPGNNRFGFASNSKTLAGNTVVGAVAPAGAATVQGTVSALNALGVRVIGMGPGAAPTTSPGPSFAPSVWLSAMARLTGAKDGSGNALVFSTSVPLATLSAAIQNAITTTTTLPVDITLANTALPPGLAFSFTPPVVSGVPPGGTASFDVTLTGSGSPITGGFDINFVDVGSGAVLGSVPVTLNCPTNQPPVAHCKNVTVSAGADCMANASIDDGSFDPDGDAITVVAAPPGPYALGTTNVTLTVTDSKGASSSCTAQVTVVDTQTPIISCPAGTTAIAGADCQAAAPNVLLGVTASDNCDSSLTLSQSPAAGTLLGLGTHIITVTATDDAGNSSFCTTTFTVTNDPPVITSITGPSGPLALGDSATVTANFTDTGNQAHTVTFSWDDGSPDTTVPLAPGVQTGAAAHVYSGAGVYTVTVTVTDVCGASATSTYEFIVVFDPEGGFVTGGGWINSPAGAYTADPDLTGKANFGFVSKYQHGATVPTGQTEFQFKAGNLNFHSSSYQWLVVSGCKAQYKGTGTINGVPGFEFVLTAYDAQAGPGGSCGGQSVDRFRIRITGPGGVVYDNNPGGSGDIDSSNPQAINGGSIVIHNN